MPYIGSRKLAREVYTLACDDYEFDSDVWEYVGGGSFRNAYLHKPTQVVYKVPSGETDDCSCSECSKMSARMYTSHGEVYHAQNLRRGNDGYIGSYMRIPAVSGYRIDGSLIVAMEYVKSGDKKPHPNGLLELYRLGFNDMHDYNFIVDEAGYVVPVDMASPRNRHSADLRVISGTKYFDIEEAKRDNRYNAGSRW